MHEPIYLYDFTNVRVIAEFNPEDGSIKFLPEKEAAEFYKIKYPQTKRSNGSFLRTGNNFAAFYDYKGRIYFIFDKQLIEIDQHYSSEIKLARKAAPFFFRIRMNKFTLLKATSESERRVILEIKYRPEKIHWSALFNITFDYDPESYDFFQWVHNVLSSPERREIMKNPLSKI